MVVVDENFKDCGKTPGMEIFRVKDFGVHPVDKSRYGNFYEGDCYIILVTRQTNSGAFLHDVHFWCGKGATKDEMGTAAIKTVELDEYLGGGPVQYRETQDHESSLFLSYFKNGIKYMQGGYESGFTHVGDVEWEPRLLHCKGKRNVRCRQVPVMRDSLNLGDVFILDLGEEIFVWMPPQSGRLERIKGIRQATNIRDQERAGRGEITVLDIDWFSCEKFWSYFGGLGGHDKIKSPDAGGADGSLFRKEKPLISLWKISDATGKMTIQKVAQENLTVNMLNSKDAFILDAAGGGLYVWIGKLCTMDERNKAMLWASRYLDQKGMPKWSSVVRVLESAEPAIFTQWFAQKPPHADKLECRLFQCSDDGGDVAVEEITNFSQEDLDGDDVMIMDAGYQLMLWIGSGANDNERASAQNIAKRYLETDSVQRVPGTTTLIVSMDQGNETVEFKQCFKHWDDTLFKQRSVDSERQRLLGK